MTEQQQALSLLLPQSFMDILAQIYGPPNMAHQIILQDFNLKVSSLQHYGTADFAVRAQKAMQDYFLIQANP